ncbi:DUF4193 family protein [Agromyces laixinhei]|uniref:DUF4193 family protein n=1 Tax=Agromyces laixinhei TaxID=2585717 RepID=UPI0012ED79D9|nr:DUF4193 family protein [Agromyces laixinhei]
MTIDYDVLRTDNAEQPLTELPIQSAVVDPIDTDLDLEDWGRLEELSDSTDVVIVPPQPSEFTCSRCFLLIDLHRLADRSDPGGAVCIDCVDS